MGRSAQRAFDEFAAMIRDEREFDHVTARRLALRITGHIADPHGSAWMHDELGYIIQYRESGETETAIMHLEIVEPTLREHLHDH